MLPFLEYGAEEKELDEEIIRSAVRKMVGCTCARALKKQTHVWISISRCLSPKTKHVADFVWGSFLTAIVLIVVIFQTCFSTNDPVDVVAIFQTLRIHSLSRHQPALSPPLNHNSAFFEVIHFGFIYRVPNLFGFI